VRSILILDDHAVCREGLRLLLLREWRDAKVDCAASLVEAKSNFPKPGWRLAIVNLNLKRDGGFRVISDLKEWSPGIEVLVFTEHRENLHGVRAFRAGAKGYLNKAEPVEELFRALESVLAAKAYVSPRLESMLISAVSDDGNALPHESLSNREWEVMRRLITGVTAKEIAFSMGVSPKSVATYRSRILEKLALKTNADLVRYSIEHGIDPEPLDT
jgi:two-component system, NarL family, invasion response regulator UvrY